MRVYITNYITFVYLKKSQEFNLFCTIYTNNPKMYD